jgi:hypothetical protein
MDYCSSIQVYIISIFQNPTYRCNSLSTVHREYAALMGIGQYDWAEDVFQARINSPVIPSDVAVRKAMIVHHLNPPQAKAVLSSLGTKGFSLIQGYVSGFAFAFYVTQ